jgi:hypothetical protein
MLPVKKGDLVTYLNPFTGQESLGMILCCNQALMFYVVVYDVEEGRKNWIRSQSILRLETI